MIQFITPRPILLRRDPGIPRRIQLQFNPTDGVTENVAAEWAEATTLGRVHPIQQYSHGLQQTITLEARFFSRHLLEDIDDVVAALRQAVFPDPELQRPPLFDFIWGEFHDVVVVSSVGGIKRGIRFDGKLREATLALTLRHYEKFDLVTTDPNAPQTGTFYRTVKEGDSWESLAKKLYGQPLLGDLLRRLHPEKPFLTAGDTVPLPDPPDVIGRRVTPRAIPLERTEAATNRRATFFAARSSQRYKSTQVKR